jgi:gas vesicle protein
MNSSKVFWSILTAAAAGAAIGMLFAPDDGVKTRKKIKSSANDWATDALDALEKGKTKVQEAADRMAKNSTSLKNDAVDLADEKLEDAKSTTNRMK